MSGWVMSSAVAVLATITLSVSGLAGSSVANAQSCGGRISQGTPVLGQISSPQTKCVYSFQAQEVGMFEVRMVKTSMTDLDPYLKLLTSRGAVLEENDDGAGNLNSLIVTELSPGQYKIEATGLSGTGNFALSLDFVQVVRPSTPMSGQFSRVGQQRRYQFDASGGEVVGISMIRADPTLDPWLDLLDPNGVLLISDDDGCGNGNACIDGYFIDRPGTYTIVARSYNDASTGSYELMLEYR